jgi:hypothetical protein
MKKYLLIIALVCGILISCKKSSNTNSDCSLSSTTIVGQYKITAIEFAGQNALQLLPSCDTANVYDLETGGIGTITYTSAPNACSTSGVSTGTWSLSNDTLTSSQENLSGVVSNFSCTGGFTLSAKDTIFSTPGTAVITLVRQ